MKVFSFAVLGIELIALSILGACSTTQNTPHALKLDSQQDKDTLSVNVIHYIMT